MTTTILLYVGLVLLALLAVQDFSAKVSQRGNMGQYFFCVTLFVALNLIIYVTICAAALQVEIVHLLSGEFKDLIPKDQSTLPLDKQVLPLVLAFAYFGVGSVNIPIGSRAVSFYGSLLKLIQGMYKPDDINIDPIKKDIQHLNTQSGQLRKAIERFNESGKKQGWNILADKWDDLSHDREAMERHKKSLKDVRHELGDPKTLDTGKLKTGLDEKIKEITQNINNKLRSHISALVEANDKNSIALQKLLSNVGLKMPEDSPASQSHIQICRAIVLSLFGGALLGAALNHWSDPPQPIAPQSLTWMVALGTFGSIFSLITHLSRNKIYWVLGLGAVAGAAGQLTLKIVSIFIGISMETNLNALIAWMPQLMFGIVFGGCLAALIHGFRYWVWPNFKNSMICYLCIALSGAVMFIFLGYMMRSVMAFDMGKITYFIFLGAFVSSVSAVITNIFHESS